MHWGSLSEVVKNGLNDDGILVNSSRGIIYASQEEDFAEAAATAAKTLQEEMAVLLKKEFNLMLNYTTYRSKEDKPWVTFIHGAGGSSTIWFKQIKSFLSSLISIN